MSSDSRKARQEKLASGAKIIYLSSMDTARLQLRQAIREAGGVAAVAERAQIHFTALYRMLAGRDLEAPSRARLRAALPSVPAEVWADVWAPLPSEEQR